MEPHRHKLRVMEVGGSDNAIGRCERRQVMSDGCALTIVDGNAFNLAGENGRNTVEIADVSGSQTIQLNKHCR